MHSHIRRRACFYREHRSVRRLQASLVTSGEGEGEKWEKRGGSATAPGSQPLYAACDAQMQTAKDRGVQARVARSEKRKA